MANHKAATTRPKAATRAASQQKDATAASNTKSKVESPNNKNPLLGYSALILSMAVVAVAMLWKNHPLIDEPIGETIQSLFDVACKRGYCSESLELVGRSLKARHPVEKGERLLEIPRSMQIWDLDALRDPFIRKNLFQARHKETSKPCSRDGFLAAYLALQKINAGGQTTSRTNKVWLDNLPTLQEFSFHPLLWDADVLEAKLGKRSLAHGMASHFRWEMEAEYEAFTAASSKFARLISQDDYRVARLVVNSRSFGTVPPGQNEALPNGEAFEDELDMYKRELGIDFSKKAVAVIPVIDLINHHNVNNIFWRQDETSHELALYANGSIPEGTEFVASYGDKHDAAMYVLYMFNTGDGRGYTAAHVAAFHEINYAEMYHRAAAGEGKDASTNPVNQQKDLMIRYLLHDDGYQECIQQEGGPLVAEHTLAAELKRVKLDFLEQIASVQSAWVVHLSPRNPSSDPLVVDATDTLIPPSFDRNAIPDLELGNVLSTCRVISLTHRDLNGDATATLKNALASMKQDKEDKTSTKTTTTNTTIFKLPRGDDALEARALTCLGRLAKIGLKQFGTTVQEETRRVARLNREEFQSPEWSAAHVRLGEMQSLQAIARFASMYAKEWEEQLENPPSEDFIVRTTPCPYVHSEFLLVQDNKKKKID
jgi:hypothetical protein